MKCLISSFIKIQLVILITFLPYSTHAIAHTDDTKVLSPTEDDFDLQPGDIILTKGPVLFGFFGHSSIALDHDTVLQIEGPGDEPITESFHSFKQRFGEGKDDWIKIYRCTMPGAGEKAAKWAEIHYKDTDKTYLVTLNLKSERFTYCTKIIYQAYKYGVSKNAINEHGLLIISPYALVDNFTDDYQLQLVKQY